VKNENLEPLPSDLEALLAPARNLETPPSEVALRMAARLETTLLAGVSGAAALEAQIGSASGAASSAGTGAKIWLFKSIALATTTFVVGGLAGAGLHASLTEKPKPPAQVTTPVPPPPDSAPPPLALEPILEVAPQATRRKAPKRESQGETLGKERALLEVARTALARGRPDSALEALQQHLDQFPEGQLSEERELLFIQSLAASGKTPEAQARGAAFRSRFPRSMLIPAVEAVLESR
jgi:TolA-binding protein